MPKVRVHVTDAPPGTSLAIYLRDHLAGAAGGVSLARRLWSNNRGTPYAGVLGDVARDISEDEDVLERVLSHLGVTRSKPKELLALAGEHAARLKLNGQLVGYSTLARVLEIEALAGGVQAKQQLWRALRSLGPSALPAGVDLDDMEQRAEDQLDRLRELHTAASDEAFAGAVG